MSEIFCDNPNCPNKLHKKLFCNVTAVYEPDEVVTIKGLNGSGKICSSFKKRYVKREKLYFNFEGVLLEGFFCEDCAVDPLITGE